MGGQPKRRARASLAVPPPRARTRAGKSILSPERLAIFLDLLREGIFFRHATAIVGVAYSTALHWLHDGRTLTEGPRFDFARACDEARAEGIRRLHSAAVQAALAGDGKLCLEMLKILDPKRYREATQKLDITQRGRIGVQVFIPQLMPVQHCAQLPAPRAAEEFEAAPASEVKPKEGE